MNFNKVLVTVTVLLLFIGTAAAYTGGSGVTTTECNNGVDDDNDGATDAEDSGCTRPLEEDNSESHLYDTDLTHTTLQKYGYSTPPDIEKDFSVFFSGEVTNEYGGFIEDDGETGSAGEFKENYVDSVYSSSSGKYGGGQNVSKVYDHGDFPDGTAFPNSGFWR